MASYQEHLARQAANKQINGGYTGEGPQLHFMGEFLNKDGDTAIIRFPYHSMDDIVYTATHNVAMPGAPYGRRIRCTETPDCEFCAQGLKVEERVFLKFIVYTVENGAVVLNNTVWDRPAAFADIDLKGLIEEYGDLTQTLFKIKRSGAGTKTRYTMLPVTNAAVYNPAVYVADFSALSKIDAEKVLSKSVEQYHAILNPNTEAKANHSAVVEEVVETVAAGPAYTGQPVYTAPAQSQPVYQEPVQPMYQTPVQPVTPQPVPAEQPEAPVQRTTVKYKF